MFKKFFRESIAFFLALIFAVHPIQVEAVSYMAAGSNIVVFLLGILAIRKLSETRESLGKYAIAGIYLLLAILTNEAGVSWILIALLYLWLSKQVKISNAIATLTPTFVIYGFLRLFVSQSAFHKFGYVPIATLPLAGRLLTVPKVLSYYLTTFLYPAKLSIAQHWTVTDINVREFMLPVFIVGAFLTVSVAVGVYLHRRHSKLIRPYLFFALWFMLGIAPYLHSIPLDMTVADRWFYVPVVGLLGMIGIVLQSVQVSGWKKIAGIALFTVLIVLLSIRTMVRNANWRDAITLYSHDLEVNPDSFDLHAKLAGELMGAKRYNEAMVHAQKAVALQPDDITSLGTLALLYIQAGEPQRAIRHLQKLISLDPANYPGLTNLVYAYLLVNNTEAAKTYARKGLKIYPGDESLLIFLSMTDKNPATLPKP